MLNGVAHLCNVWAIKKKQDVILELDILRKNQIGRNGSYVSLVQENYIQNITKILRITE